MLAQTRGQTETQTHHTCPHTTSISLQERMEGALRPRDWLRKLSVQSLQPRQGDPRKQALTRATTTFQFPALVVCPCQGERKGETDLEEPLWIIKASHCSGKTQGENPRETTEGREPRRGKPGHGGDGRRGVVGPRGGPQEGSAVSTLTKPQPPPPEGKRVRCPPRHPPG